MATGLEIVQDSLYACGAYGVGDPLSDADAQLVLRRFNRMIESWANDGLTLFDLVADTLTMVAGTASYSTTSLASTLRPASIDSCYVTLSGIDYPVRLIDNQTYQDFRYKAATGTPEAMYPNANATDWTMSFYPTPNAAYVATVVVRRLLATTRITLASTFTGPPGYEKAMVDNLAVDIGPSFGRPADQITVRAAQNSLSAIKAANYIPLEMYSPFVGRRGNWSDIFSG